MTIEMTMAKRGRSMKMLEIIDSGRGQRGSAAFTT